MSEKRFITGRAAALSIDNLDTDQIMPKQFLRGIDKSGLAQGVLYNLRNDKDGNPRPDFILNRTEALGTKVLIGGSNFGCGSSREHAVWGLLQFGIQAIIAPSFGEIFYSNALGNRLLLIQLSEEEVKRMASIAVETQAPEVSIDVAARRVSYGNVTADFPLSDRHQSMFLQGVDVIGMTLNHQKDIAEFAAKHWASQPWLKDVARRMRASTQAS